MQQKKEILSDEQLVVLILDGDQERFGDIVDRYETKLRRYVSRITAFEDETIDEILQGAFLKAYKNLAGFNTSLRLSSWMYRIAHNEAIDYTRKHKHAPVSLDFKSEDTGSLIEILQDSSDLEHDLASLDIREGLVAICEELPQKYRDVLVLHFLEGRSYDEVSDILRKPPGTIATWINRAKKQLLAKASEPPYLHLFQAYDGI